MARKDLEEFFSHYGEVAVACFTVSVGKYMRMEERLRQLKCVPAPRRPRTVCM